MQIKKQPCCKQICRRWGPARPICSSSCCSCHQLEQCPLPPPYLGLLHPGNLHALVEHFDSPGCQAHPQYLMPCMGPRKCPSKSAEQTTMTLISAYFKRNLPLWEFLVCKLMLLVPFHLCWQQRIRKLDTKDQERIGRWSCQAYLTDVKCATTYSPLQC